VTGPGEDDPDALGAERLCGGPEEHVRR
jgi:hypothetical protein